MQSCKRCNKILKHIGNRKFHEGGRFEANNREELALFLCESCGEVTFFIPEFQAKEEIKKLKQEVGSVDNHPRYHEFLEEDIARKSYRKKDRDLAFTKSCISDVFSLKYL